MYQAYVVQKFGDNRVNIVLGTDFPTADSAYRTICTYEQYCGKCECAYVQPAGTPIPKAEVKKMTWKEKLHELLLFIAGK